MIRDGILSQRRDRRSGPASANASDASSKIVAAVTEASFKRFAEIVTATAIEPAELQVRLNVMINLGVLESISDSDGLAYRLTAAGSEAVRFSYFEISDSPR